MPIQIFPTSACSKLVSTWYLLKSEHRLAIHSFSIQVSAIFWDSKQCVLCRKVIMKVHNKRSHSISSPNMKMSWERWQIQVKCYSQRTLIWTTGENICSMLFKIKEPLLQNLKQIFSMCTSDFIVSLLHRIHQTS